MAAILLRLFTFFTVHLSLTSLCATHALYHQTELPPAIIRFQHYLRINTAHPKPNYAAAVSYLRSQAQSIGLQTLTLEFAPGKPILLLTWPGSDPSLSSILLNSHLDSVPAEASKWVHPPFSAVRSPEGEVFARGAQDDKCIGMQYLEAIRALKSSGGGFTPTRSVHLSYLPDEEIGGLDGAARFAASKEFRDLNIGFMLDEGQASTGNEFRVFYADRSPWGLTIRASGAPGHGSRLLDGTAMENLMESIEVISRFRGNQFDMVKAGLAANSEVISVNPVFLQAGIHSPSGFVMNVQPSEAAAGFDVRLPPTADPVDLRKRIACEWAPAARNMSYQVSRFSVLEISWLLTVSSVPRQVTERGPMRDHGGRPLMTPANDSSPWWVVFKQAISAAGGKLAVPEILASTTDARYFRQLGIPVLGFSPITDTPILLHDHNEFLRDAVYLKGIKVYEALISSLSAFDGVDLV